VKARDRIKIELEISEDSHQVNQENNNYMNLAAQDNYGGANAYLNVLSESDDEFQGKRVRIYSYDPEKGDGFSDENEEWKYDGESHKPSGEPRFKSHVIAPNNNVLHVPEPIKKAKKKKRNNNREINKKRKLSLLDSEDEMIDTTNLNAGMIVTKK